MEKADIQYEILKSELELTQRQMDKYDQLSSMVKAWAVTLWAAAVGWSFQVQKRDVLLVSLAAVIVFWSFDAMNKRFREDYKRRRDEVAKMLSAVFASGAVPAGASAPDLPAHEGWRGALKSFFRFHVALPYLFFCAISLILYFSV